MPTSRLRRGIETKGVPVQSEQLSAHLRVARYGDFNLTDAVRPGLNLKIVPREGYRADANAFGATRSRGNKKARFYAGD